MKGELSKINRDLGKLEAQMGNGSGQFRVTLTPVEADGTEGHAVDVYGNSVEPGEVNFKIVAKILPVLISGKRHNLLMGGRSAAKSHSLGRYFVALAVNEPCRILCLRHIQSSLQESVYYLLRSIIESNEYLSGFFEIQANAIIGRNGSEFTFKGTQDFNAENIKSYESYKYAWLEESQSFTRRSLDLIIPTLRIDGSALYYNHNAVDESDAVYQDYALAPSTDTDLAQSFVTFEDNFFCPKVIKLEAEKLKNRDIEKYNHIYGGALRSVAESRIFHNWKSAKIEIHYIIEQLKKLIQVGYRGTVRERKQREMRKKEKINNAFYFGLDFGYIDPVALTMCYLAESDKKVFILKEFYREKVEIDELPGILKDFDERIADGWPVSCDNSRPEIISYLRKRGINAVASIKNRLIDRIDDLQTYDIIIDTSCVETSRECSLYSWAEDRNGNILPTPRDEYNHCIDSVFYALGNAIKQKATSGKYAKMKNPYV